MWLRGKNGITDDVSFKHHVHRIGRENIKMCYNVYVFGVGAGTLLFAGAALMYFRLSLNYGNQPIFKPREMRAAFHEDRLVRLAANLLNIFTVKTSMQDVQFQ